MNLVTEKRLHLGEKKQSRNLVYEAAANRATVHHLCGKM
jgi:hypothetical protein